MNAEETDNQGAHALVLHICKVWIELVKLQKLYSAKHSEEPPVIVDALIPYFSERINKTILVKAIDLGTDIECCAFTRKHEILIVFDGQRLNRCWTRYVLVRELVGLLVDHIASEDATESLLYDDDPLLDEQTASLLSRTIDALKDFGATELIVPPNHRAELPRLLKRSLNSLDIAYRYLCPEVIVKAVLKSGLLCFPDVSEFDNSSPQSSSSELKNLFEMLENKSLKERNITVFMKDVDIKNSNIHSSGSIAGEDILNESPNATVGNDINIELSEQQWHALEKEVTDLKEHVQDDCDLDILDLALKYVKGKSVESFKKCMEAFKSLPSLAKLAPLSFKLLFDQDPTGSS